MMSTSLLIQTNSNDDDDADGIDLEVDIILANALLI